MSGPPPISPFFPPPPFSRPPGETAADRADVDDPLLSSVRRSFLPFGSELQHRLEHVTHPYDRSLVPPAFAERRVDERPTGRDRKSTRLNSSHSQISYAVFCL